MAESFTVRTPVEGYSGVIAGVVFDAGRAVVDGSQTSALRYFRDAGYHVEAVAPVLEQPKPQAVSETYTPVTATPQRLTPAKKAPAKKAAARKAPARKKKA